jgi:peroxiredoxin
MLEKKIDRSEISYILLRFKRNAHWKRNVTVYVLSVDLSFRYNRGSDNNIDNIPTLRYA